MLLRAWQAAHPGADEWGGPWYHAGAEKKRLAFSADGEPELVDQHRAVKRGELVGAHRLVLRVPEKTYLSLWQCARWDGVTISRLVTGVIEDYVDR
jgi:hypothetical protein